MRILQNAVDRDVTALLFAPGGKLVAGGSGGFGVWDLLTGASTSVPLPSLKTSYPYCWAADPRGEWFYYSSHDTGFWAIRLDGSGSRRLPDERATQHVLALAVAPDGRLAVSRDGSGLANRIECWIVRSWDDWRLAWCLRDGEASATIDTSPPSRPSVWNSAVAFSPDGGTLAVIERVAEGEQLVLRDAAAAPLVRIPTGANLWRVPLLFLPCGKRLATLRDTELDLWDVAAAAHPAKVIAPGRANFRGLAVHPSGRFLATAGGDGVVRLWDAQTLRPGEAYKWGIGKLHSVAFNEDGTLGAAGGAKGKVVVWDVDV